MSFLKKYVSLARIAAIHTLEYRSEILLWFIMDGLPFFILFYVWQSIYSSAETVNGYSLSMVIEYYVLVFIIDAATHNHFEQWRCKQIREGKIDFYLIRPIHYIFDVFYRSLIGKGIYFLLIAPFLLLSLLLVSKVFAVTVSAPGLTQVATVALLIPLAFLIHFFLALWTVLLSFWFEGSQGLEHFKWIVITLFSGSIFPLAFMPEWLKTITLALPLKYLNAIPIGVIQGTVIMGIFDWLYLFSTVAVFTVISLVLWRLAVREYSSSG